MAWRHHMWCRESTLPTTFGRRDAYAWVIPCERGVQALSWAPDRNLFMFFGRSKKGRDTAAAERREPAEAERLVAAGLWTDAVELLTTANHERRDPELEAEIRRLRNRIGMEMIAGPDASPDYVEPAAAAEVPQLGEQSGVPETTAAALTAPILRAAILERGCLLVRGLVDSDRAERLAGDIDRAFAVRQGAHPYGDGGGADADGYYDELAPEPPRRITGRGWIAEGGGVLAADSPRLFTAMLDAFAEAGLKPVIEEYLGERPLISAQKCTLRKADPGVVGAWHQDGKFLGPVKSINVWVSLSRCGDVAPGMDLVPRRLDEYVRTGGPGAWVDHQVGPPDAEAAAGDAGIVRPVFDPGDALIFDHLFLHQTGSDESMTQTRYAIESWFFTPSAFPEEYVPLAF
jgi:hypothetical protein